MREGVPAVAGMSFKVPPRPSGARSVPRQSGCNAGHAGEGLVLPCPVHRCPRTHSAVPGQGQARALRHGTDKILA